MSAYKTSIYYCPKGNDRSPGSHYESMGTFVMLKAANSKVSDPFWLKIERMSFILHASLKSIGSIAIEHKFFRHSRADNSLVSRQIWPKFKHNQRSYNTCSHYLQVSKVWYKNNLWRHHFPHYKYMGVFVRLSRAENSIVGCPIWPKFELLLYTPPGYLQI